MFLHRPNDPIGVAPNLASFDLAVNNKGVMVILQTGFLQFSVLDKSCFFFVQHRVPHHSISSGPHSMGHCYMVH